MEGVLVNYSNHSSTRVYYTHVWRYIFNPYIIIPRSILCVFFSFVGRRGEKKRFSNLLSSTLSPPRISKKRYFHARYISNSYDSTDNYQSKILLYLLLINIKIINVTTVIIIVMSTNS